MLILVAAASGLLLVFLFILFGLQRASERRLKNELEVAATKLDGCRREIAVEHARGDAFRDMLGSTEYVLWEVHALGHGAKWPGTEQTEALCEQLGDHSVLKVGTELAGYSYWADVKGDPKIGCRYV
jgi:hypothetical protein